MSSRTVSHSDAPRLPHALLMHWVKGKIQSGDPEGLVRLLGGRLQMLRAQWPTKGDVFGQQLAEQLDTISRLHDLFQAFREVSAHRLFLQWLDWSHEIRECWPITAPDQWDLILSRVNNRVVSSCVILATVSPMLVDARSGTERLSALLQQEWDFWNALPVPPGPQGSDASSSYVHRAVSAPVFAQLEQVLRRLALWASEDSQARPPLTLDCNPRAHAHAVNAIQQCGNVLVTLEQGSPCPAELLGRPLNTLIQASGGAAEHDRLKAWAEDALSLVRQLHIATPQTHEQMASLPPSASAGESRSRRLAAAVDELMRNGSNELSIVAGRIQSIFAKQSHDLAHRELLDCLLLVDDILHKDSSREETQSLANVRGVLRDMLFSGPESGPYEILDDSLCGRPRSDYADQVDALPGIVRSPEYPADTIVNVCRPGYLFRATSAAPVVVRKAVVRVSG